MHSIASKSHGLHRRALKWLAYLAGIALTILATIVVVYALQARARLPELRAWHQVELESEFRHGKSATPTSFADYQALEEKLFAEMRERVIDNIDVKDMHPLSRYNSNSAVAQLALDAPFNHSFELVPTGAPLA